MRRHKKIVLYCFLVCVVLLLTAVPALAQPAGQLRTNTPQGQAALQVPAAPQITGVLGSPNATTTISGKQLPPPPPKFGGKIERNAAQSKPWWAPRVVPAQGRAQYPAHYDR